MVRSEFDYINSPTLFLQKIASDIRNDVKVPMH